MRKALSRAVAALTLAVLMFGASSCFGSFKLTTGLADWNGTVSESKWVNELVFLGLIILPVYEIAIFVDAIVMNSIEFWSGKSAVESSSNVGSAEAEATGDHSVFPAVNG